MGEDGRGNWAQWAHDNIFELPGGADAQVIFHEGYPDNHLTLQPHQQAEEYLSTESGEFGLTSTEARRILRICLYWEQG